MRQSESKDLRLPLHLPFAQPQSNGDLLLLFVLYPGLALKPALSDDRPREARSEPNGDGLSTPCSLFPTPCLYQTARPFPGKSRPPLPEGEQKIAQGETL